MTDSPASAPAATSAAEIRLHDTRSGQVVPLVPKVPGHVGVYACGPTVYSRIHVGNARPFVVFSLLARFLRHRGLDTTLVINVTDVNDKIYTAASAAGRPSAELAAEMTAAYRADTDALQLGRPDHEPLASESIAAIVAYIAALIERGHAYESGGDVFFRVRSGPALWGAVEPARRRHGPGRGPRGRRAQGGPARLRLVEGAQAREDTHWASPWGDGRPGWHIECSAMAEDALGVPLDIHGGGSDLIFPHHENEAAQTRAARGVELAQVWVHNGMIRVRGSDGDEKMAKSVGNIAPLHEVVAEHGRDTVVMYLVSGHYRQPVVFSPDELLDASRRVERIRDALARLVPGPSPDDMREYRDRFLAALADDYNTPAALAAMFDWIREGNRARARPQVGDADLREMLDLLGLGELGQDAAPEDVSRSPGSVRLPARRATMPPRTAFATRPAPSAGTCATGRRQRRPAAALAAGWRVIVYGRNPCARRSAAAAPARPASCGRPSRRPASRGWPGASGASPPRPRSPPAAAQRAPGHLRRRRPLPARLEDELFAAAPTRCCTRRGPRSAESRRAVPHGRMRRRGRRCDPRAPRSRGHPGRLQGLGGRRRAPRDRARAQPLRLPRRGQAAPLLVLRRRRARDSRVRPARLPRWRRARIGGGGPRPAAARREVVRRARRAAAAGSRRVAQRQRGGGASCCTGCLQSRAAT